MKKASLVFLSLILAIMLTMGYFLFPAYGAAVEVLGGNGGMDSGAQTDSWTLVNKTGTSAWTVDTAVYHAGAGSGRLDSPVGADVPVDSYVYYSFETNKVPESATLDLAYKKQFSGTEPAPGNWNVAVELWESGGSAPLQIIDIDTGNTNADFTAIQNQNLTGITKINTRYELRLVQKGQTGNDPAAKLTTWFDEVKLNVTYDSTPPGVAAASAPTDRSVDVVFSEALDKASAETAANYSISPALNVTRAELQPDGKTVRLTTDVQERETNYTVTADSIRDISGNAMTAAGTASFTGVDTTPPAVASAAAVTDKSIDLRFNEAVDPTTAQTAANYEINPALPVTEAVLQPDGQTVRLTTGIQTLGTDYQVTVTNVRDLAANVIDSNNTGSFKGIDSTPPQVVSAVTPGDTTVNLLFNEPVDPVTAQNAANYSISPQLSVSKAVLQSDGKTVQLTTERHAWQVSYTVSVSGVTDTSGNVISGGNTASFTGVDSTPPQTVSATQVSQTTVDVLFNEAVDAVTAQAAANYSIYPALAVNSAVLKADGKTVSLTTEPVNVGTGYTVTATGVSDLAGNVISGGNTSSFTGEDMTLPKVSSASALDYKTVDVIFNDKVDPVSAQAASNYAITPGLTVKRAVLQTDGFTVRLTTTPQTGGAGYTVTVTGVADTSGNFVEVNNNTAAFTGISPPVTEPPRVISALAPNNTAVVLKFSATMDPVTTQNPANYNISPALPVTGAVLQKDGVTVRLTTATQLSGTVYSVTVANVQDQYGNVMGAVYNTANFTGSAITAVTPHGRYLSDTNQCALCHVTHNAPSPKLIKQPTQTQLCYLCHDAAGQSQYDVASDFGKESSYSVSHHGIPEGTQQCTDCHNPHDGGKDAADNNIHWPRLLQSKADPSLHGGNEFCLSCHQTTQGDTAALDPAVYPAPGIGHNNTSFVINGTAPFNPASGTGISCMGCHKSHGSELERLLKSDPNTDLEKIGANDNNQCYECHLTPSADKRYLGRYAFENSVYNPHALTSSMRTNVSYPGVAGGKAGQCVNCHDSHGTAYGTSQVSMKTLRGTYNGGKTSYTAADFGFCFGCHNNTSPDAKYDVQTKYNAPNGGHMIKTAGGSLEVGSKLPCESCHSLHGSANSNKYLLKDSLGSNLGDGRNECLACHQSGKTVEGIAMQDIPQGIPEHIDNQTACLSCHGSPHELK